MASSQRLEGKVALVTGATREMGAAIARRLAGDGAAVVGVGRSAALGESVVAKIRAGGGRAEFVAADVSDEQQVAKAVARAVEEFGRLDVVVNNAASIGIAESPVVDLPTETFDRVLRTNLYGPFWFAKYAIPAMDAGGGGAFVAISSIASSRAVPGIPAYSASKAGLEALTRQIAVDYAGRGIRANSILVALIASRQEKVAMYEHPAVGPKLLEAGISPRAGTPEDVASAVAFLASDESGHITGAVVYVDGGASLKLPWTNAFAEFYEAR